MCQRKVENEGMRKTTEETIGDVHGVKNEGEPVT